MSKLPTLASDIDFYAEAVRIFQAAEIPFLVGGAYALRQYTGVIRDTKDFDVFLREEHLKAALAAFRKVGFHAEITFPHWLAKVHYGENFIDIIFRSGNGLCEVDDLWFRRHETYTLLGRRVGLVPPEEIIWQKAYIMERERFDGADIAHLIRVCGEKMDWEHLLRRFGADWRVLLSHVILFGFIYPSERNRVPQAVLERLLARAGSDLAATIPEARLCQGTLISRAQYLPDIERWGYNDARLERHAMAPEEIEDWTNAIGRERAS